ncbi:15.4 kDa class V heat shock protein [Abeliophyllum distichum]|uniref:15.4 kDa class V heat shock protein n=1 Tax=Abeliophyllum distichum TaxID=126358 RepID=A0ABD1UG38_9LAMI
MELPTLHPSYRNSFFPSPHLFPYHFIPQNYVHWTQTPESHIYSAHLPGVKKEEIRVEVEDSKYLIIRTEAADETSTEPIWSFTRKFRLPGRVDINGISAGYEDGVLTVTVPRSYVTRGFFIDPEDMPQGIHVLARAA